jgi:cytoskeleton protein RodZ
MGDIETTGEQQAASSSVPAVAPHPSPAARPAAAERSEEGSFGRALAAAREAHGLSQGDVAGQLRLHLRQVQAIESEDLAALPAGPFVRGYVRNYARLVDLPAEPLLSLLNTRLKPADPLRVESGSAAISPIQRAPREPLSGRVVIGGVLVALVLLAVFGWWTMRADEKARTTVLPEAAPPARVEQASPPPAAAAAAAPTTGADVPPGEAQARPAPSGGALRLTFRDRSWVEIRQADGTVLLSKNNAAGSTEMVEGVPPYTLVIGNASKVDLEYRGQPVDLASSVGRGDTARLRLE